MDAAVEKALEKAWYRVQEQKQLERDELAIYFDLYTRDYAPDGMYSATFCFYDKREQPPRYFRKVPRRLTDEEAQALKAMRAEVEASAPQRKETPKPVMLEEVPKSSVGAAFHPIAVCVVIIAVVACALIIYNAKLLGDMAIPAAIGAAVSGLITALLFAAIGDALILLQTIADNTRRHV